MDKGKTRNKGTLGSVVNMVISTLCIIFLFLVIFRAAFVVQDIFTRLAIYLLMYVWLIIAVVLSTVIHEAGHLVGGLITGYRFRSFRIYNLMLVKDGESGKLCFARYSLAGTGGQCLMAPPPAKDGKLPVTLYDLGGVIMNLIFAAVSLAVSAIPGLSPIHIALIGIFGIMELRAALANGIPMRVRLIDNDGRELVSAKRSPKAAEAFMLQLSVYDEITKGVRLRDMPDEWFYVPSDDEMMNLLIANTGYLTCLRLIDGGKYREAAALMDHFIEAGNDLSGLSYGNMVCDRISVGLIIGDDYGYVGSLLDDEQKKFMLAAKKSAAVMRTEYICTLLLEKDMKKAEEKKKQFDLYAEKYPYQSDIAADRELIALAEKKAAEENGVSE